MFWLVLCVALLLIYFERNWYMLFAVILKHVKLFLAKFLRTVSYKVEKIDN